MAATGLFLCLFLVGHLVGNLQLFISGEAGREAFNVYAHFMVSNPAVKLLSYLTYLSILFHAVDGFVLTKLNRKARPVSYAVEKPSENSSWMSRNMMVLGTIMLVFIVVHMQNFWWQMHFGAMPIQVVDGVELHDLYTVVYAFFNPAESMALLSLALYVAAMFAVGFHLWQRLQLKLPILGLEACKIHAHHSIFRPGVRRCSARLVCCCCRLYLLDPSLKLCSILRSQTARWQTSGPSTRTMSVWSTQRTSY